MGLIKLILILISGPLFLLSILGRLYLFFAKRPGRHADLDDYYYEFEDQHPAAQRYERYCRLTFTGAVISAVFLFAAMVL